jgi:hypothetical protein
LFVFLGGKISHPGDQEKKNPLYNEAAAQEKRVRGEIYYYLSRGQVAPSTTGVDKIDRPVRDVHV